jgi:membrane protein DedA with SNARE-associated domain
LLYGLPVLFGVIVIASVGAPLPVSLMLVAAGSFVEQGELKLWQVIIVAAAVLGDQIGYGVVRWGGRRLVARISRRIGGEAKIRKAEALAKRRRTDHPGAKNSQPNPGAFLSEIVQY